MINEYFARQAQLDLVELAGAFDRAFSCVVPEDTHAGAPSQLHQAMRHATLNGGKRIRPRLLLAVAEACNGGPMDEDTAEITLRAALAVELIHAASLVHDDLPCFDDADLRRGQPTVHRAYGEALAVLTGDALITLAFETLADYEGPSQRRALKIVRLLSEAAGSARGIIGGQSLELAGPSAWGGQGGFALEFVEEYHEKKTAALFDYATRAAAIAVGVDPSVQEQWGDVGTKLGLAFQLIDDLYDIHSSEQETGKTTGRDRALQRPNGAILEGSDGAVKRLSQLVIRGATVMKGYWEKPEATAKVLKPGPLPGEQVLYTGDYCRIDEEGYLYFVGRRDDVFKSGGEKVAPKEIEAVLYDIPGVKEAAVIGVPDEVLGKAVKAYVVLEQGVTMSAREVQRHCQARLESYFVPRQVEFVADLPKTDTGKIRKLELA